MALAAPHRTVSHCCPLPHADLRYPPSSISLHPEQHVGTGTNVTIRCWNNDYGATFFLHKDGSSDPLQCQDSSGGGTATFILFGVTPADSGTYRCSYHPKNYSFLSSPLGDSMTLEVTPTPAPPGRYLPPMCLSPVPPMGGSVITSLPHGADAGDEHTQVPVPHRC